MSTNFYIRGYRNSDDPGFHIGKRSAAGLYCWDCRTTLCKDGEKRVHYGKSEWYDTCPQCNKEPIKETFSNSSIGRELGFNKNNLQEKHGVSSCSSFSWAMTEEHLKVTIDNNNHCPVCFQLWPQENVEKVIEDEYGHLYSFHEFMWILKECPIQFRNAIGTIFS